MAPPPPRTTAVIIPTATTLLLVITTTTATTTKNIDQATFATATSTGVVLETGIVVLESWISQLTGVRA